MKTKSLFAAIHDDLTNHAGQAAHGMYAVINPPRFLTPLLEQALETEDELKEKGTLAAFPGGIWHVLKGAGLLTPLLKFDWQCFGPTSTCAWLCLIGSEQEAWLAYCDEFDGLRAVAALRPGSDPGAVAAVVQAYLAGRPEFEQVIPLESLPGNTVNQSLSLVSGEIVEAAYREHLERSPGGMTDWRSFVDCYIQGEVEPDQLQRTLRLLGGMVLSGDGGGYEQWLAEAPSTEQPSPAVCDIIFDSWWEQTYSLSNGM